jgi:hypothetical protein
MIVSGDDVTTADLGDGQKVPEGKTIVAFSTLLVDSRNGCTDYRRPNNFLDEEGRRLRIDVTS